MLDALEALGGSSSYSVERITVTSSNILHTGRDFLLSGGVVISVANDGWFASIYPDLHKTSSQTWAFFVFAAHHLNKYDQVKYSENRIIVKNGSIDPKEILLEFVSLMQIPVPSDKFKNYQQARNLVSQLGWSPLMSYPFHPVLDTNGIKLYSVYGQVIFRDSEYLPMKIAVSNLYIFPDIHKFVTDNEMQNLGKDPFISVSESGLKLVVEKGNYTSILSIISSMKKVIGLRYGNRWKKTYPSVADRSLPYHSKKLHDFDQLLVDYTDAHTMQHGQGVLRYKKRQKPEVS